MTALVDGFDGLLLDLDGTVYLGHRPIEFVAEALLAARLRGSRSIYVTNNASRPPAEVAEQLSSMGLAVSPDDVLTSPQAAAELLVQRHPQGSAVLVVGAPALAAEVARRGLRPVRAAADNPVAVVQGHSPETGWPMLAEACLALRAGADWVAANVDATLPTDRGLLPGNGAMVAALMTATGLTPRVAGKPARPLIDTAIARFSMERPLVVGDRLDTDIEAAVNAGVPSLLVFTGVSTPADLMVAPAHQRPTYLSFDLRGLVEEGRVVEIESGGEGWGLTPSTAGVTLVRTSAPSPDADTDDLHAIALLARNSWSSGGAPDGNGPSMFAVSAGDAQATTTMTRLGLDPR